MSRFLNSLSTYRQLVALTLAVGISSVLLSLSQQNQIEINRTVMITLLAPAQKLFAFLPVSMDLRRENEVLRDTVMQLKMENTTLQEGHYENDRLRRMLGLKKQPTFTYVPAEVIARDTGRRGNTVVLDVGSRSGARRYMAVVTPDGLLGRVIEAAPYSSIVQLLTDPDCRVSGLIQRSRSQGSVAWQDDSGLFVSLPIRSDIRIGDHLVTSGLGGAFPPGLVIGQVKRLELDEMGLFKRGYLQSQVDLNRLEEVYILVPRADSELSAFRMNERGESRSSIEAVETVSKVRQ